MGQIIIAGNWKMYKTPQQGANLIKELVPLIKNAKHQVVVFPPYVTYEAVKNAATGSNIATGMQNMHWQGEGAYTGEISPEMLQSLSCQWVIIGHSERREYFAETDETVNQKLKAALTANIRPILCVGETLVLREKGEAEIHVAAQIKAAFKGLNSEQAKSLVVAYEPIWAIGTGKTASQEDAEKMCQHIRNALAQLYGEDIAQQITILYGGSVKPENIVALMGQKNIDGVLVGGASLQAQSFAAIANYDLQ